MHGESSINHKWMTLRAVNQYVMISRFVHGPGLSEGTGSAVFQPKKTVDRSWTGPDIYYIFHLIDS